MNGREFIELKHILNGISEQLDKLCKIITQKTTTADKKAVVEKTADVNNTPKPMTITRKKGDK